MRQIVPVQVDLPIDDHHDALKIEFLLPAPESCLIRSRSFHGHKGGTTRSRLRPASGNRSRRFSHQSCLCLTMSVSATGQVCRSGSQVRVSIVRQMRHWGMQRKLRNWLTGSNGIKPFWRHCRRGNGRWRRTMAGNSAEQQVAQPAKSPRPPDSGFAYQSCVSSVPVLELYRRWTRTELTSQVRRRSECRTEAIR